MNEPWLERWAEGRIGWHEADGNAALKRHWGASGRRVLVPLCGKSPDLLWLAARGNAVTGVELSELAVQAFFEENGLAYERKGSVYSALDADITLHCGDFFAFEGGGFDAHYDRAALIALPDALRPAYVSKVDELLNANCYRLVITLEYDQSSVAGPPFSVPADEVTDYWPQLLRIDEQDNLENVPPRFREAGVKDVREVIWRNPGGRAEAGLDDEPREYASPPCLRHELDPAWSGEDTD